MYEGENTQLIKEIFCSTQRANLTVHWETSQYFNPFCSQSYRLIMKLFINDHPYIQALIQGFIALSMDDGGCLVITLSCIISFIKNLS